MFNDLPEIWKSSTSEQAEQPKPEERTITVSKLTEGI
jgi:hypothetical protein